VARRAPPVISSLASSYRRISEEIPAFSIPDDGDGTAAPKRLRRSPSTTDDRFVTTLV
jgi:hypothetical protein